MRLNKFLAAAGIASRRHADELITAGRIKINGKIITQLGTDINPEKDKVSFDDKEVSLEEKTVIYILNKPKGVITTADDPEGRKTVLDLVPKTPRVFSCGRLDEETMGLVVLTNDGNLCYQLTHPSFEHKKEYFVEGQTSNPEQSLKKLSGKIVLNDGPVKIDELKITRQTKKHLNFFITVHEGRNRIVRRICASANIEVLNLTRTKLGDYELGDLAPGKYREL